jgi:hypothetical protein
MKRLIVALSVVALAASVGAADAKTSHKKRHYDSRSNLVQKNVRLRSEWGPPANADFRYGPQIEYPQSPPGVGGN